MPTRKLPLFLAGIVLVLSTLIAGYALAHPTHTTPQEQVAQQVSTTSAAVTDIAVKPVQYTPTTSTNPSKTTSPQPTTDPTTTATLQVEDKTYILSVLPDETVETAMKKLTRTNSSFTYIQKIYPSLGQFVTTINGKENENGYYWFLYVNGTESNAGITSTTVRPGDKIEWKYQK